jgi:S1-C subfamily serine protease
MSRGITWTGSVAWGNRRSSLRCSVFSGIILVIVVLLTGCGLGDRFRLDADIEDGGPSQLLANARGQNQHLTGVGRLDTEHGVCTAVFIETVTGRVANTAPAYVLTNAHCIEFLDPNVVLLDQPSSDLVVTFNYFADIEERPGFRSRLVSYATMKGTDIAVIELVATTGDLIKAGIEPLAIADDPPNANQRVVVVGAPVEGHDSSEAYLRASACRLDGSATVVEADWHFIDVYRNRCSGVGGGSSGAPVLSMSEGEIVGLVNTVTPASSGQPCTLNHPCEIEAGRARVAAGQNYAVPVAGVGSCFDGDGLFQVGRPGCPLDSGEQADVEWYTSSPTRPWIEKPDGTRQDVTWKTELSGGLDWYRYKVVTSPGQCRDANGYGASVNLRRTPVIDASVPEEEGWYFLCILAGPRQVGGEGWQDSRYPTIVQVYVDATPPTVAPMLEITERGDRWAVSWRLDPPELASVSILVIGGEESPDCRDAAGYMVPELTFLTLSKADGPYTLCAVGQDVVGNAGEPVMIRIE